MAAGSLSKNLALRALIITLLIAFGFYLAGQLGLLRTGLEGDKSYISYLILVLYLAATLHWLWLARALSTERRRVSDLEDFLRDSAELPPIPEGRLGDLLASLENAPASNPSALTTAFADELANRHALGHFVSDVLLKLGLMGTVVGFILMLMPIGGLQLSDPTLMQTMLSAMSSGMSIALYTTLAGLVTSTLLKGQYYLLDASLAEMINRLTFAVNGRLDRDAP